MGRPKAEQPTPAELAVLKILWDADTPQSVRDVLEQLNHDGRERAYTSVMSLLNVMADKGQLDRERDGRAFLYSASTPRDKTLGGMVGDLWQRAFDGSASSLVTHLLGETRPTTAELDAIRKAITEYRKQQEST